MQGNKFSGIPSHMTPSPAVLGDISSLYIQQLTVNEAKGSTSDIKVYFLKGDFNCYLQLKQLRFLYLRAIERMIDC